MNLIYLLIGGNMGDRMQNLSLAVAHIRKDVGKILKLSGVYETAAWGNTQQPDFLNQVLLIKTKLSPRELMDNVLSIEKKMGRVRNLKNASRIIDIDILFFNDEIIDQPGLSVPHPEIPNRRFVLIPLSELNPGFLHPVLGKSIKDLLSTSQDNLDVRLLNKS